MRPAAMRWTCGLSVRGRRSLPSMPIWDMSKPEPRHSLLMFRSKCRAITSLCRRLSVTRDSCPPTCGSLLPGTRLVTAFQHDSFSGRITSARSTFLFKGEMCLVALCLSQSSVFACPSLQLGITLSPKSSRSTAIPQNPRKPNANGKKSYAPFRVRRICART